MAKDDKQEVKVIMTEVLADFWESVITPILATKEDLKSLATKQDLEEIKQEVKKVDHKINKVATDVRDIKRRVMDIEIDTPTKSEFDKLTTRVDKLTN